MILKSLWDLVECHFTIHDAWGAKGGSGDIWEGRRGSWELHSRPRVARELHGVNVRARGRSIHFKSAAWTWAFFIIPSGIHWWSRGGHWTWVRWSSKHFLIINVIIEIHLKKDCDSKKWDNNFSFFFAMRSTCLKKVGSHTKVMSFQKKRISQVYYLWDRFEQAKK